MNFDLVSIIIPTYNRPNILIRAIDSALNQTYKNIEVIVVDDNNPNTAARKETEEIMKKYSKKNNVKYIKHECNKNGSAARNTGFKFSEGKYIMLLDDDDEYLPKKVESQIECLKNRDESWGGCYTKFKRVKKGVIDSISTENREGKLFFEGLCRNLFIQAGSNLMIRRNVFEELGGFDEKFFRNQDIEFTVRLLKKYKLAYVEEFGLIHNCHLRSEKRNFDLEKITKHYLSSFENVISDLSDDQKETLYKIINLQLIRYKLLSKKNIREAIDMILKKDVRVYLLIKYFIHLGYRKISKKSCGFNI